MSPRTDLIRQRIVSTGLAAPSAADPSEAVARLGCAQGQDLPGVIASIALRVPGGTAKAVTDAMSAGEIVRGYPMRGTVFAVHANDLAWMNDLLRPSFTTELQRRRANQGVDAATLTRIIDTAHQALDAQPDAREGLTRAELARAWSEGGEAMKSGRTYHFISTLMMEGRLAYGPWDDEVGEQRIVMAAGYLPPDSTLEARFNGDRIAAISEWLNRYFRSHGPATVRDFAWWTKLSLKEIRAALPAATTGLAEVTVDDSPAWCDPAIADANGEVLRAADRAMLTPGFDELVLGYGDRAFLLTKAQERATVPGRNGVFRGLAIERSEARATWRRAGSGVKARLELTPFEDSRAISNRSRAAFERAFNAHPWLAT